MGYEALCVMLVFEGLPCTFLGLSFSTGTSKGWAGAVSGIYFSSTVFFEMKSCVEAGAHSPLHPASLLMPLHPCQGLGLLQKSNVLRLPVR